MTIDVSDIKRMREAAGLTQAELADKVGIAQQTIEKIENGKVSRTGYLREIAEALNVVPTLGPEMILAVAASQWEVIPTPRQIIKALEAGGFKIVLSDISSNVSYAPLDPVAIVREILERRGISANKLAESVGLAASTLNRALNNPEYTGTLSTRTINKIIAWDQDSPNMSQDGESAA